MTQNLPETTARVVAIHREKYSVISNGETLGAILKSSVYHDVSPESFPTVGDYVSLRMNPSGDSLITKTLPRASYFSRRDPDPLKGEQAIAANFDYVFIVSSLNADYNEKRLLRYLVLAKQSGAEPIIVLTKADLCHQPEDYLLSAESAAGGKIPLHAVSAVTGEGMDALAPYLEKGKTIVLLGSSGVGKSSLVNALMGKEVMYTQAIREDDAKGRHTTTHRQLLALEDGAFLIDTPGMRELGMWNAAEGLDEEFQDIRTLGKGCRFADCTHRHEPFCAVQAAIKSGLLPRMRLEAFEALERESAHAERKAQQLKRKAERVQAKTQSARKKRR